MKKVFAIIRNRYFVATIGMAVWILWFDRNDLFSQLELKNAVKKLEDQKAYLTSEIRKNREMNEKLKSPTPELIKFAREKYLMKSPDEVIYYFEKQ